MARPQCVSPFTLSFNFTPWFIGTVKSTLRQVLIFFIDYHKVPDGGARGVVVIVVGNGHGDTSSNPGPRISSWPKRSRNLAWHADSALNMSHEEDALKML